LYSIFYFSTVYASELVADIFTWQHNAVSFKLALYLWFGSRM